MKKLLAALTILPLLAAGCAKAPAPTATSGTRYGVSLSPKSFSAPDVTAFLDDAMTAGGVLSWAGKWDDLGAANGGGAAFAMAQAKNGFTPVILVSPFDQSSHALFAPLDDATEQRYADETIAFVTKHHPPYLGIGVEIDALHKTDPASFDAFAAFFDRLVPQIKAASPDTKVFTVFQLEQLRGLRGGLFGGTNDPSKNDWDLIARFPKADLVGFTTYPSLIYHDPNDIPDAYYSDIAAHVDKPVVFIESGWPSGGTIKGWKGSPTSQASFVTRFRSLTSGLRPEFVIWSFLDDQRIQEPFTTMGLKDADGAAKPAWDAWIE